MAEFTLVKALAFDMVATIHRLWKLRHHIIAQLSSNEEVPMMQSNLYGSEE